MAGGACVLHLELTIHRMSEVFARGVGDGIVDATRQHATVTFNWGPDQAPVKVTRDGSTLTAVPVVAPGRQAGTAMSVNLLEAPAPGGSDPVLGSPGLDPVTTIEVFDALRLGGPVKSVAVRSVVYREGSSQRSGVVFDAVLSTAAIANQVDPSSRRLWLSLDEAGQHDTTASVTNPVGGYFTVTFSLPMASGGQLQEVVSDVQAACGKRE